MDTGNLICDLQCLLEIIEGYKDSSKNKRGIFHCCFIAVVEFKCGQSFQVAWGFSGIISASCTTLCNESHTTHLPGPAPRLMWVAEWSFLQHLQYMCLSCFWQSLWNIGIFHGVFGFHGTFGIFHRVEYSLGVWIHRVWIFPWIIVWCQLEWMFSYFFWIISTFMKEILKKKKKNPLLVCLHSSCRQKGSQHTHCKLSAWQLTKCVVIWTSLFYDQINAVKPEFCNCHLLIHRLCHSYSHVIQLQQWMKSKLFHHWQKKVMIVAHLKSADC